MARGKTSRLMLCSGKSFTADIFVPGTSTEDDRWKERLHLLTEDERADMEKVVEKKLEQTTTRVLAWEPDEVD